MTNYVMALPDWFGPTAYKCLDGSLVWSDADRHKAARWREVDMQAFPPLSDGWVWMPESALETERSGERK